MAGGWCLASWDMLSWCHSSSSVNHSTLCFHWCAAQLQFSCCNSLCVSCSSLNTNWVIKEVPCWQAFRSYSILAFLPLFCDSHPNARNLWNHSWSRHCMIWLGFSRWLYPLFSWCGKIPFSDWQLRQDLNWNFYFFCSDADNGSLELHGTFRYWPQIEISAFDLAFQMAAWSNGHFRFWLCWLNYYQTQKQKWQHLSLNMYVCHWSLLLLKFVEFAIARGGCRSDKQDWSRLMVWNTTW